MARSLNLYTTRCTVASLWRVTSLVNFISRIYIYISAMHCVTYVTTATFARYQVEIACPLHVTLPCMTTGPHFLDNNTLAHVVNLL